MKRVSTATRLSISLVALTLSVLLAAQSLGLVPDPSAAALKGRKAVCESIAIGCSLAARQGDVAAVRAAAEAVLERNRGDILSLGLRRAADPGAGADPEGALIVETPAHRANWKLRPGERSTADCVQVPIFQGEKPWGTLEVCFAPIGRRGLLGLLTHPVLRLMLFTSTLAFVAYLLYLRKTLRYLDPSSVIPERVKAMLDTLAEGVLVLDKRERVVLANDAFAGMIGRPASEMQGLAASTFPWLAPQQSGTNAGSNAGTDAGSDAGTDARGASGGADRKAPLPWSRTLKDGTPLKGAQLGLRADVPAPANGSADSPDGAPAPGAAGKSARQLAVNCSPIHSEKGGPRGVLLTFDDVTEIETTNAQLRDTLQMLGKSRDEIQRQNKELQALATTDPLTGCLNRRSFHAEFQTRWGAANRYAHSLGCVMVDVDFFKKINDRFGHSTGDLVLQHVAGVLRSLARESDVVCRYGGEEFCVLLPESDVTATARAAERYRSAIESSPCGGVKVTASVGASALNLGAESPQELLDQADKALYAAKRGGRNRVVRWDEIQATAAADGSPAAPAAAAPSAEKAIPIAFHAVTALMSALAHRDKGTADHSRRVADLCAAASAGLMPARERFVLEVGALLHDIGKLGVPDAVLLKAGPLNDAEWKVMRSHDRMGVEIISAAFGSAELTEIVRAHHARYANKPRGAAGGSAAGAAKAADKADPKGTGKADPKGTGKADGKGEADAADLSLPTGRDIPLGARLLALADAYDAMVSDRPYRGARDRESAFNELRRCAGEQFDPDLIEPFIAAVAARDRAREAARAKAPPAAPPVVAADAAADAARVAAPAPADCGPLVPEETALRLRLEVERLACAADARDLAALADLARQVAATAAGDGLAHVAERLRELERAAAPAEPQPSEPRPAEPDFEAMARTVNELLELVPLPRRPPPQ